MSTKTLRKRIALVAVSALGAGLLSVVAVPSASATAPVTQRYESNVNANATAGVAGVSSSVLTTGTPTAGSIGLLGNSGNGTTQTAVLLATGTLSATLVAYSGESLTASVTGGTFTAVGAASGGVITAPANTSASNPNAGGYLSVLAKPNSGATSMVVTMSTISPLGVSTTRARITTTIVATSAYNAYSPTYSTVYWGDGSAWTATTDATAANSNKASGGVVDGKITLTDAYGNLLTSSNTSLVTVSATGGALVKLGSLTTAGDRDSDYTTLSAAPISFNVQQEDSDVPLNSTVTISVGGTVVATKSLIITGEVASVTASLPKIGKLGSGNTDAALIAYADSKGNRVYPTSGTSVVSSTLGSVVSAASVSRYGTSAADDAAGGFTTLLVTCALGGTQKGLQVSHLNSSGTTVKSNAWDAGCADVPYTVTASFDKASYKRGEVATLTLSFKDSKGNLANAYDEVVNNTGPSSAADLTITGGPGTIVTAVADGDKPSRSTGAKTYQFTVTLDDGDYNAIVVPAVVKLNNALQANLSVPFSVTSTAGVTNADVLKAIVSLIASINKQIAALQKALLRR
jgi:hypothetical protein